MPMKDYYRTWETITTDRMLEMRREGAFRADIFESWPQELDGQLSLEAFGPDCIRAFVYLDTNADIEVTQKAVAWAVRLGFKMERKLREEEGRFYWCGWQRRVKDMDGEYDKGLFIENAHSFGCKLVKKEVTRTIFEAECPEGIPVAAEA